MSYSMLTYYEEAERLTSILMKRLATIDPTDLGRYVVRVATPLYGSDRWGRCPSALVGYASALGPKCIEEGMFLHCWICSQFLSGDHALAVANTVASAIDDDPHWGLGFSCMSARMNGHSRSFEGVFLHTEENQERLLGCFLFAKEYELRAKKKSINSWTNVFQADYSYRELTGSIAISLFSVYKNLGARLGLVDATETVYVEVLEKDTEGPSNQDLIRFLSHVVATARQALVRYAPI